MLQVLAVPLLFGSYVYDTDGIPPDGSPITIVKALSVVLLVFLYAFGVGGIIFCIICLTFNIVFRKRRFNNDYHYDLYDVFTTDRIVRLTSPNLNYCIIAGAILIYGSVFVSLPVTSSVSMWDIYCKVYNNYNAKLHNCCFVL